MRSPRSAVLPVAILLSACGANVDNGNSADVLLAAGATPVSEKLVIENPGRIAAGGAHVLGLSTSGVVYAWGDNNEGQLGNGYSNPSPVPVLPATLTRVQWLAAGTYHSVAVRADGSVWAWGDNRFGQLGNGSYDAGVKSPTRVNGVSDIVTASASLTHTVALSRDGSVWGWGWYPYRTATSGNKPVLVRGLSDVRKVVAGGDFDLALKGDSSLWGWGSNYVGQLGAGSYSSAASAPVKVAIDQVTGVAAGYLHALALRKDGTVWAWGSNQYGQLGSSGNDAYTPRQVLGLPQPAGGASGIKALAAGGYTSAVLYADGSVWVWGLSGAAPGNYHVPVRYNGVANVVSLAVGNGFVSMINADGRVFSTGANDSGQLGNNTFSNASVPVQVVGLSGVKYLGLGASAGK